MRITTLTAQDIAEALSKLRNSKRGPRAATGGYQGTPEASAVFEAAMVVADVLHSFNSKINRNDFADTVRKGFDAD